jgi:hypothetical protein
MYRLLATLVLVSPLAVLASDSTSKATVSEKTEVRGDAIAVRVGEETGLPSKGVTRVTLGDVEVIEVSSGGQYLRVKGLKPGYTKLVLHKGSASSVTHAIYVK